MSKRSLFWGMASGKLGEAVFYRAGGEQRARAWVPTIKNPKTLAQVENRLSMLNLVTAYRQWSEIIKTGWPLKKSNQSDYNAFVSANKSATTSAIPKEVAAAGLSIPDGITLLSGNVEINTKVALTSVAFLDDIEGFGVASPYLKMSQDELTRDELLTLTNNSTTPLTGALIYKALVGSDNPNNLPPEFNLFVFRGIIEDVDTPAGAPDLSGCNANYAYIKVSAESADTVHKKGFCNIYIDAKEFYPESTAKGQAGQLVVSEPATGETGVSSGVYGFAISYTQDGVQKVTTSVLYPVDGANTGIFAEYKPGGAVYEYALKSMGYNPDSLLATK